MSTNLDYLLRGTNSKDKSVCTSIVPRLYLDCTRLQTSNVPATTLIDDNIKSLSRRNNGRRISKNFLKDYIILG
jgi:hypothetical protein